MSPTYFAPESILGGGERFAEELSLAMSRLTQVKLVSFGPRAIRERPNPHYERVILRSWSSHPLRPFSMRLFAELRGADVIHCHQYYVLPTFFACIIGRLQGSRVFVTDLGGGDWTPAYQIDQSRWIVEHLPLSEYAALNLPGRNKAFRVIHGGVDLRRYPMRRELSHDGSVVFLGRVLPHKGVHQLIAALAPGTTLYILGTGPDLTYLEHLRSLAQGKDVRFHLSPSDSEVLSFLGRAMALVHPMPVDAEGSAAANELFGLALVEAMACGCPVIASAAASLPEIVVHGETGLLVPPNSPAAIACAIAELKGDQARWRRLALGARQRVESRFTWDHVAAACLSAYAEPS